MNEDLKVLAKFAIDLGENASQSLEDGKFTASEAFSLLPIFMQVPDILKRKDQIKDQWNNRASETLADLNTFVQSELTLANKSLEAKIEKGVTALVGLLDFLSEFQKPAEAA